MDELYVKRKKKKDKAREKGPYSAKHVRLQCTSKFEGAPAVKGCTKAKQNALSASHA